MCWAHWDKAMPSPGGQHLTARGGQMEAGRVPTPHLILHLDHVGLIFQGAECPKRKPSISKPTAAGTMSSARGFSVHEWVTGAMNQPRSHHGYLRKITSVNNEKPVGGFLVTEWLSHAGRVINTGKHFQRKISSVCWLSILSQLRVTSSETMFSCSLIKSDYPKSSSADSPKQA